MVIRLFGLLQAGLLLGLGVVECMRQFQAVDVEVERKGIFVRILRLLFLHSGHYPAVDYALQGLAHDESRVVLLFARSLPRHQFIELVLASFPFNLFLHHYFFKFN